MRTRLPALVAMGALVVLAAVVARGTSAVPVGESKPLFGWLRWPWLQLSSDDREAPPRGRTAEPTDGLATVVGWVILLLPVVALIIVIAIAVVLSLRMRRLELPTPVARGEESLGMQGGQAAALVRAAQAARRVLDEHASGPPGDAVIAAWLELERVAADAQQGRQAHQTPTEFTNALTSEHATIARALDELRTLYHRARFGRPGAVGEEQAEAARRALDEITASMVAR